VEYHKLTDRRQGERSSQVRERVRLARERQIKRFEKLPRISANADLAGCETISVTHVAEALQYRPRKDVN
jgi:predicted ATPase with chaperone activity